MLPELMNALEKLFELGGELVAVILIIGLISAGTWTIVKAIHSLFKKEQ